MLEIEQIESVVDQMKAEKLSNYVIAGLDSYLLTNGVVRLFENSRDHQDQITPHSHRFDFTCLVLSGHVTNRVWEECDEDEGDFFQQSDLMYEGEVGKYKARPNGRGWWRYDDYTYDVGEVYTMKAEQVHSIQFSRGAKVLFFEGADKSNVSTIIEPVVNDEVITTCKNRSYMFQKEQADD